LLERQNNGLASGMWGATMWFTKMIIQGYRKVGWAWCQLHPPSHHLIRVVKG
jgi:hypothetical protein